MFTAFVRSFVMMFSIFFVTFVFPYYELLTCVLWSADITQCLEPMMREPVNTTHDVLQLHDWVMDSLWDTHWFQSEL